MSAYTFIRGDADSVLYPLSWLTLIIVASAGAVAVVMAAIWLFARWHWVRGPAAEYAVHQLSPAEVTAVEWAITEATSADEQARIEVIRLSAQGGMMKEIAYLTGYDKSDVESWLRLYEECGLAALQDVHTPKAA
ncbi:MAG TPA: helix-turn-helix domain-containing protein [Blastocatellia bacterium]|nr:helix-turn-helix domain-containing protein [Blastocatellia bacterium]